MKIQFLTSKNSWINLKKKVRVKKFLKQFTNQTSLINSHKKIKKKNDILIILSYFKIIPEKFLKISKHNIVVHESDLPNGKGFSPISWQILEGKKNIVFTLFEASPKVDCGSYYQKEKFYFKQDMLFEEIKNKQLESSLSMVLKFIRKFKDKKKIKSFNQSGKSFYYKKRSRNSSKLDFKKSLFKQINLLRIVDNENYPAFFFYQKKKYLIKISKEKK